MSRKERESSEGDGFIPGPSQNPHIDGIPQHPNNTAAKPGGQSLRAPQVRQLTLPVRRHFD
jgi:hypothetical protein